MNILDALALVKAGTHMARPKVWEQEDPSRWIVLHHEINDRLDSPTPIFVEISSSDRTHRATGQLFLEYVAEFFCQWEVMEA